METAEPYLPLPPADEPAEPECSVCGGNSFEEVRPVPGIFNTVIYVCNNCEATFNREGVLLA